MSWLSVVSQASEIPIAAQKKYHQIKQGHPLLKNLAKCLTCMLREEASQEGIRFGSTSMGTEYFPTRRPCSWQWRKMTWLTLVWNRVDAKPAYLLAVCTYEIRIIYILTERERWSLDFQTRFRCAETTPSSIYSCMHVKNIYFVCIFKSNSVTVDMNM